MENRVKSTPKDVFSYLLMIAMLYVSVVSVLTLLFQYINISFPDQLSNFYSSNSGAIQRSMASLFVVWPVYMLMSWFIGKDARSNPEKRDIRVRRWLLYLTLFIAAITIIIDLITLIFNFLGGELSLRFFLKVLAVLIVALAVFGFYLWDIRREINEKTKLPKTLAWVSSGVILLIIIIGFFVGGSPSKQRQIRFDQERVRDLQLIQGEVTNYWRLKGVLPRSLDILNNDLSGFRVPHDPDTDIPYGYEAKGDLVFELCAEFSLESQANTVDSIRFPSKVGGGIFDHKTGYECFERTIDPDLFSDRELNRALPLLRE